MAQTKLADNAMRETHTKLILLKRQCFNVLLKMPLEWKTDASLIFLRGNYSIIYGLNNKQNTNQMILNFYEVVILHYNISQ